MTIRYTNNEAINSSIINHMKSVISSKKRETDLLVELKSDEA